MVLDPTPNFFSYKFKKFLVCHSHYDKGIMLYMVYDASHSSHLFPLIVFLLPLCSSQIGWALVQMLTCRLLEDMQSNAIF